MIPCTERGQIGIVRLPSSMNPEEYPELDNTTSPHSFVKHFQFKFVDDPDTDYFLIFDRGSVFSCKTRGYPKRYDADSTLLFKFRGYGDWGILLSPEHLSTLSKLNTLTEIVERVGRTPNDSPRRGSSEQLFLYAVSREFEHCKVFPVPQMPRCKIVSLNGLAMHLYKKKSPERDASPERKTPLEDSKR